MISCDRLRIKQDHCRKKCARNPYQQNAKNLDEAEIKGAINGLFQQLDDPSAYNAPRFATQMQKVSALLSAEKGSR